MKSVFVKLVLFFLVLALVGAACTEHEQSGSSKETAAPTGDAASTEETAQSPDVTDPAGDPGMPVFAVSDFSESAQLLASIVPGDGENDLRYAHFNADGSGYEGGPVSFFVSEGKLYLRDPYDAAFSSLFVYDLESGEAGRLFDHPAEEDASAPFAAANGLIITNNAVFDTASGESVKAEPAFPTEHIVSIFVSEDGVRQLIWDGDSFFTSRLEFDPANLSESTPKWSEPVKVGSAVLNEEPPETLCSFGDPETGFASIYYSAYIGDGPDGSHFFAAPLSEIPGKQNVSGEHTELLFLKFDAEGNFVKAVSPAKGFDALYGSCEAYYLGADGYIYLMMGLPDSLEVYRIGL